MLLSDWHCYCCYFYFLEGRGEFMARGMHFRKLRSEEYTAPSSLCSSVPVSARGLALFTQDISQFRKGLELYYKKCISGNKIRWRLQLVGFSYDKKRTYVDTWKDKDYEYISSAWKKQQQGAHHSSLAISQPRRMLNNLLRLGRFFNQHSLSWFHWSYSPDLSSGMCW